LGGEVIFKEELKVVRDMGKNKKPGFQTGIRKCYSFLREGHTADNPITKKKKKMSNKHSGLT
jgi:hypothetical protein